MLSFSSHPFKFSFLYLSKQITWITFALYRWYGNGLVATSGLVLEKSKHDFFKEKKNIIKLRKDRLVVSCSPEKKIIFHIYYEETHPMIWIFNQDRYISINNCLRYYSRKRKHFRFSLNICVETQSYVLLSKTCSGLEKSGYSGLV